jgi:hypothetical protein
LQMRRLGHLSRQNTDDMRHHYWIMVLLPSPMMSMPNLNCWNSYIDL